MSTPPSLRAGLTAGDPLIGTFQRYPDASLTEMVACQGWDFIILDAEHGTIEPLNAADLFRACEVRDVSALVRVDHRDHSRLTRFMDCGAAGCHIAGISGPDEARAAISAVRYSAEGVRGLAGNRGSSFGTREPLGEYVERSNRETLIVAQIETAKAVENLDAILKVEGVDLFFLGPADLSLSLGVPGELGHPDVLAAVDTATEKILAAGRPLGIFASTGEAAKDWVERGAVYVAAGFEGLVKSASDAYLAAASA